MVTRYFDGKYISGRKRRARWLQATGMSVVLAYTAAYAANGFNPALVADFVSGFYAQDGAASTFADLFTYTGASLKTMVDSDGVLKWAPHNFQVKSEDLATWSPANVISVTGGQTGPGGSNDAYLLEANSTNSFLSNTLSVTSGQLAYRVWAKAGTVDYMRLQPVGFDASADGDSYFNLANGTVSSEAANHTASVVSGPDANGFYLCEIVFTTNTDLSGAVRIGISSTGTNNTSSSGDNVTVAYPHCYRSDLGGMADNLDTGDSYVPTTSSAVYMGRVGHHKWNGSAWVNKGLLLESEARTNLITQSNNFEETPWSNTGSTTIVATNILSPDGTNNATHVAQGATSGVLQAIGTVGSNQAKSIWARSVSGTGTLAIGGFNGLSKYRVTLTEQWQRFEFPSDAGETGGTIFYAVDFRFGTLDECYIYGAQLEAVSAAVPYASSYIPTSGATATRAAETLAIAGAKMPSYTTAVSIAMAGEIDYGDAGSGGGFRGQVDFYNVVGAEYITAFMNTGGSRTGQPVTQQRLASATDTSQSADTNYYTPGLSVPFSIAARHGTTFIQGAEDGTAFPLNTNPTSLVDLSTVTLDVCGGLAGTLEKIVIWGADIGDTGIEEASA
jgi:hypothetical protein